MAVTEAGFDAAFHLVVGLFSRIALQEVLPFQIVWALFRLGKGPSISFTRKFMTLKVADLARVWGLQWR